MLRRDLLLGKVLEGRLQGREGNGRPRTMLLDWLMKNEHENIGYDQLKIPAQDRISK